MRTFVIYIGHLVFLGQGNLGVHGSFDMQLGRKIE
jgi:hypothetical protein